ncbi:MAG: tRNA dihydrouridine synthase DusB [Gammaproteobacteria bacterium]|nr:tRNA dihydrouridine synthase DusB [Gammaproteobacteria bacterium]NND37281.1 tRNA dihydrouridine synthase DusB [Gammaproteobacteria bacterium]
MSPAQFAGDVDDGVRIGPHRLPGRVVLAPMAGISDAPFRRLCVDHGAALAATEMTLASHGVRATARAGSRLDFSGTHGLRAVQIAGSEPAMMANAAREAVQLGAQIVDINMGCPAKKVCRRLAGSALLKDEELVRRILDAVVEASRVPVTLKIRTGWNSENRNGVDIARIAERSGVMALAVHGRTRACGYKGEAEYETIRKIKSAVNIPVFANGDIDTPEKALHVLSVTQADGVMIGRGAQGQPWLFDQVTNFILKKVHVPIPSIETRRDIIRSHLDAIYRFYGEQIGVRVAKKHLTWYCMNLANSDDLRFRFVRAVSSNEQMQLTKNYFDCRH